MSKFSEIKISRNPKIAWQRIEDKIVVINPQKRKVHILSGSGVSIWEHLSSSKTLEDIIKLILEEYEIDEAKAIQDIKSFIELLGEKELVIFN